MFLKDAFWKMTQGCLEDEYSRYQAVIHLRSPTENLEYNKQNPLRIESAGEVSRIENKIATIWSRHPRYVVVESSPSFMAKASLALNYIKEILPEYCRAGFSKSKTKDLDISKKSDSNIQR